jgi:hypothetical protein
VAAREDQSQPIILHPAQGDIVDVIGRQGFDILLV